MYIAKHKGNASLSLLANGPADAPRMVPDMAKNVARREVKRIVNSEGQ